ncbi:hypothetical protein [Trujillonella endophytica]|uniref:Uncharacterized protein n=1 Tax=Trujillonella endophytica TaxID=673521 RepID=A0A1H8W4W9_9ACTN|nr:hypothetical protein [Trujillella endophytica]SEP22593.1 hypothetical protein SAMN05660991_04053 [Trujillella endophytica]
MTDPYGPYRPAPFGPDDVEYEVVSPPLPTLVRGEDGGYGYGYPGFAPAPAPAAPAPADGRPAPGTAAAALALTEGGLLASGALGWVVVLGTADDVDAGTGTVLAVLALTAVAALLVIGGLGLLRGAAPRWLTAATWAELGLLAVLTLAAVAALAADRSGGGAVGVLLAGLALAAAPAVRLVLLARLPVRAWLDAAAPPATAPVWSPVRGRWVPPRRAGAPPGVLAAVAVPAAALAVVALVVVPLRGTGDGVPFLLDPYAAGAGGSGTYAGDSPWGERYYRDGRALPAPPASSHLYDAEFDAQARDCAEGDMNSCDELYWNTPVDDFYEWFGASCAGRVDHEVPGGCVDLLGPQAD